MSWNVSFKGRSSDFRTDFDTQLLEKHKAKDATDLEGLSKVAAARAAEEIIGRHFGPDDEVQVSLSGHVNVEQLETQSALPAPPGGEAPHETQVRDIFGAGTSINVSVARPAK